MKEKMLENVKKLLKSTAVNGGGGPSWFIFYEPPIPAELEKLIKEKRGKKM